MAIAKLALMWAAAAALALAAAPAWTWIPAGAVVVLAVARLEGRARTRGHEELQRHLARARRSGGELALLVARPRDGEGAAEALCARLRSTDATTVWRGRGAVEAHCTLDGDDLDRHAVEHRLASGAGARVPLGWATFPADGLTLEELLEEARARLSSPAPGPTRAPTAGAPERPAAQTTSPGGSP